MSKPELRQFAELTESDFERHPVWIACHNADYDEPWYEDTDEQTFRPRTGALPAEPSEGMLLTRATFRLADGSRYSGFVTPAFEDDLGIQQPQVLIGGKPFGFWGGMFGVPAQQRKAFYAAIGRSADAVFPLRFSVDPGLATGATNGVVEGFYKRGDRIEIER